MAKSNMNNLDSACLSKVPYNITTPSGGYSHNTQMYNLLNKNLKFILSFKRKKSLFRFLKLKGRSKVTYRHTTFKKRRFALANFQIRKTTLTFIKVNNVHLMTYTAVFPKPYLFRMSEVWAEYLDRRLYLYKNFVRVKKL